MSAYRIVLILTIVPSLIGWLLGKAGKVRTADIALIMFSLWAALSLFVNHGGKASLQPSAVGILETVGAYFLARRYIRDADDFYNMTLALFRIFVLFLPFAILEAIAKYPVFLDIARSIAPTFPDSSYDLRWGLRRAQVFVEHPILFGICTGSIFALVYLVLGYNRSPMKRLIRSGMIFLTTFFSLSSGPLGAVIIQIALIAWDRIFKQYEWRWKIIILVALVVNFVIAAVPNQSLPGFYTSLAFNEDSAYFRVLIWRFASASALNHPLVGVGHGEWDRPAWMPSSIDMFWVVHAVRYGLPAGFLMLLAFFSIFLAVGLKKGLSERLAEYRTAYLLSMTGLFIAGWTVHYWNATYVLFLFLLGSGVWLLDARPVNLPSAGRRRQNLPRQQGKEKEKYPDSLVSRKPPRRIISAPLEGRELRRNACS